jgi:hypothetical protein
MDEQRKAYQERLKELELEAAEQEAREINAKIPPPPEPPKPPKVSTPIVKRKLAPPRRK